MNIYNKKGIALFMAIILLLLISISVVIILLTASNYATFAGGQVRRTQAIALAESGIHYAYWKIRTDSSLSFPVTFTEIPPISMPDTSYSIQVVIDDDSDGDGFQEINSTVTYKKVKVSP